MQCLSGRSRLIAFSFCLSDESRNNMCWHLFLTIYKIFLNIFLRLSVFVVCILSMTQISFKSMVLLLFCFLAVRMTQQVRNFVAWTISYIEIYFRSLFQAFPGLPSSIVSFFLLHPDLASGSFVNMLLLCTFDFESWIFYFHQHLLSNMLEFAVLLHAVSTCEGI